jgi:hypothetical protein
MKVLNFAKNLTKTTIKGVGTILSALSGIGLLVVGFFTCLFTIGYVASLFGLLIVPKDGSGEYIFTGYIVMLAFVLLYVIGAGIHGLYKKIKEIWEDS